MPHLDLASAILLAAFAGLAAIDGLLLHLWRYRLHAAPGGRREHALHTLHALLFPGMLLLVWSGVTAGPALWAGTALALAGLAVVAWDSVVELRSRTFQGGLPRGEATLHALLHGLQVASLALSLAARPAGAWSADAPPLVTGTSASAWVADQVQPGALVVALVHVVLWARPALLPRRQATTAAAACAHGGGAGQRFRAG